MKPRFDMYTLVHKGQRKKLFELTIAAGQLASDDAAGRAALTADIGATLATLVDHAESEERYFGPLYREVAPATGARLEEDHRALDERMATLREALARAQADASASTDLALYRALASFTGAYLAHLDAEEASMPELWARLDDAALARAQGALVASHPVASVQFNLRNMLPAASSAERVAFLRGLRQNMPAPAFTGVRGAVGAFVTPAEWSLIDGGAS